MANVIHSSANGADDRGQLLLVTALVLATLFVAMALVLNAVIYTENYATRGDGAADVTDGMGYRTAALEAADHAFVDANRNDDSYASIHAALTGEIGNWSSLSARHAATNARDAGLSVVAVTNGTRIAQEHESRALTNVTGATSWELVAGANGVRSYRLTVSEPALATAGADANASELDAANVFNVTMTDSTAAVWRVFVSSDGSDVVVRVQRPDGTLEPACSAAPGTNDTVSIGVTDGTVGGAACPALGFVDGLSYPVDLAYGSGHNAAGTYTLVVDRLEGVVDDGDYAVGDDGATSPYTTEALFDATVELRYDTPVLRYRTTIEVVPGVSDG